MHSRSNDLKDRFGFDQSQLSLIGGWIRLPLRLWRRSLTPRLWQAPAGSWVDPSACTSACCAPLPPYRRKGGGPAHAAMTLQIRSVWTRSHAVARRSFGRGRLAPHVAGILHHVDPVLRRVYPGVAAAGTKVRGPHPAVHPETHWTRGAARCLPTFLPSLRPGTTFRQTGAWLWVSARRSSGSAARY